MDQLNDLLKKCIDNNLNFDYFAEIGSISISKTMMNGKKVIGTEHVTDGHIDKWRWNTPEREIERMRQEVDVFIKSKYVEEKIV